VGCPLLGWPAFASGAAAVLVDIDGTRLPPGRTPISHSVAAAPAWTVAGWAAAACLAPAAAPGIALAVAVAFATHLALDSLTPGGIFLWPRRDTGASRLLPFPPERLLVFEGQQFLVPVGASDAGDPEGALPAAWGGWRSWGISRKPPGPPEGPRGRRRILPFDDRDQRAGLAVSGAGLGLMLLALLLP